MSDDKGFIRFSRLRPRAYKRRIDYDEVRRLRKEGVPTLDLARQFGVSRYLIYWITKKDDPTAPEPVFVTNPLVLTCPKCGGVKSRDAKQCRRCADQRPISTPPLVYRRGRRWVSLGGVELGRIVKYQGRYAVVERGRSPASRRLCYWDGPDELVPDDVSVTVLGYKEFPRDAFTR